MGVMRCSLEQPSTIDGTRKAQTLSDSKNLLDWELLKNIGKIVNHFNKFSADTVYINELDEHTSAQWSLKLRMSKLANMFVIAIEHTTPNMVFQLSFSLVDPGSKISIVEPINLVDEHATRLAWP